MKLTPGKPKKKKKKKEQPKIWSWIQKSDEENQLNLMYFFFHEESSSLHEKEWDNKRKRANLMSNVSCLMYHVSGLMSQVPPTRKKKFIPSRRSLWVDVIWWRENVSLCGECWGRQFNTIWEIVAREVKGAWRGTKAERTPEIEINTTAYFLVFSKSQAMRETTLWVLIPYPMFECNPPQRNWDNIWPWDSFFLSESHLPFLLWWPRCQEFKVKRREITW